MFKMNFVLSPLLCACFLTACSIESDQAKAPAQAPKPAPKQRLRTEDTMAVLSLPNKTDQFSTTGFNAFRGELLRIQPIQFTYEERSRGQASIIDTSTWGGCDSFHNNCWNKHSETYSQEYNPPIMSEIAEPMIQVHDFLPQVLLMFRLRSGNEVVCSASSLLYEKSNLDAYLLIENTTDCLIYQNDSDEVFDVSVMNRINFAERTYMTGTYIRHDDGDRGGYTEAKYIPSTLLKIKLSLSKAENPKLK